MKLISILTALLLFSIPSSPARADDRAVVGDALGKVSAGAQAVAQQARKSDDKAVRKKFAAAAAEIGDDLDSLARRIRKDTPLKTIAAGLADTDRDATTLIDAADDAEDKAERKTLRAQAQLLEQGIATVRKALDAAIARNDSDSDDNDDSDTDSNTSRRKKKSSNAKPTPMSPEAFSRLVAAVRSASFDDDKVAVIREAVQSSNNYVTSAQTGSLMDLISFDESRIEAAVACWPHLTDPQNSFSIYSHLNFDSSKDELRKRVSH
jgi:hypothetical protein